MKTVEASAFFIGQTVYCVDESAYQEHLSKRKMYKIEAIGSGSKEGKVRIKGDENRLVYLPDLCFVADKIPEIIKVTIDDEIKDPGNDCIEVSVFFDNEEKRFLRFTTPKYIQEWFSEFNKHFVDEQTVFVPFLDSENIYKTVYELDRQNELIKHSILY